MDLRGELRQGPPNQTPLYLIRALTPQEVKLLTEAEVQRSFKNLLTRSTTLDDEVFNKADALLEELRPESPLRHRLSIELEEIRKAYLASSNN
ncbi:MAG: hypothetical protein QGG36_24380 [Pirellulaceae bacterium]|nr:hypothetical protein [Pirellulaceae bacterium]